VWRRSKTTSVAAKTEAEVEILCCAVGRHLWKIAETQYGHGKGAKYQEIFEANKPLLKIRITFIRPEIAIPA